MCSEPHAHRGIGESGQPETRDERADTGDYVPAGHCAAALRVGTRLDFLNRPQATHRYDHRGGHGPTPPQPKQATAFTTSHAHIKASIASAAKA